MAIECGNVRSEGGTVCVPSAERRARKIHDHEERWKNNNWLEEEATTGWGRVDEKGGCKDTGRKFSVKV